MLGLWLAGWGAARLVGTVVPAAGVAGQFVAVTVAIWNPYVAERLLQGHWSLLVGYGALPWVATTVLRLRDGTGGWWPLPFWIALAGLTPTGLLLAAVVALVGGGGAGGGPTALAVCRGEPRRGSAGGGAVAARLGTGRFAVVDPVRGRARLRRPRRIRARYARQPCGAGGHLERAGGTRFAHNTFRRRRNRGASGRRRAGVADGAAQTRRGAAAGARRGGRGAARRDWRRGRASRCSRHSSGRCPGSGCCGMGRSGWRWRCPAMHSPQGARS